MIALGRQNPNLPRKNALVFYEAFLQYWNKAFQICFAVVNDRKEEMVSTPAVMSHVASTTSN